MTKQTPQGTHTEQERHAYNATFDELGLGWFWDRETHQQLHAGGDAREGLRRYLQTQQAHLLKAYDADFLVEAIHGLKARRLALADA